MPHSDKPRPWRAHIVALPLALLACSGLAACGSSSTTTTGTAASAAATSSTKAAAAAPGATATQATGAGAAAGSGSSAAVTHHGSAPGATLTARLTAMRSCLQKSGVTLPASGGPSAMFRNPQLPKGMTRAQYAEAVRKCGTGLAGGPAAKRRLSNTRFRQALVVFADCLRQNGVPVPPPNTSGKGPLFDTRGLDTASPKFRQARQKCRSTLLTALRATAHTGTR